MKKIELAELLQLQLDILQQVDSFCRKEHIEYFLAGGTGIGAVRHGGYIPWDDDIDIAMTRPNYNRFIKSFNGAYQHLKVFSPELDWNYYAPYANVCDTRTVLFEGANGHCGKEVGVKIDVFPFDGVPDNEIEFKKVMNRALKLKGYASIKRKQLFKMPRKNIVDILKIIYTLIRKIALFPIPYSTLQKKINGIATDINWNDAKCLMSIVFPSPNRIPCRKEVFDSYCDIKFEHLIVRNITNYDEYLRSVFSNYMELPPIEKRIPIHNFEAFWKE